MGERTINPKGSSGRLGPCAVLALVACSPVAAPVPRSLAPADGSLVVTAALGSGLTSRSAQFTHADVSFVSIQVQASGSPLETDLLTGTATTSVASDAFVQLPAGIATVSATAELPDGAAIGSTSATASIQTGATTSLALSIALSPTSVMALNSRLSGR